MKQTKELITDTFWQLLEEKPYNKITVQDIVDRCDVNRNTFYYHFQDIPTLMINSMQNWMDEVIRKYAAEETPVDCLTYMAEECTKRRKAFLHLYASVSRDKFLPGLNQTTQHIVCTYVDKITASTASSAQKESMIRCYKSVFIGSLMEWLEEGASFDLTQLYDELCDLFAGSAKRAVLRHSTAPEH